MIGFWDFKLTGAPPLLSESLGALRSPAMQVLADSFRPSFLWLWRRYLIMGSFIVTVICLMGDPAKWLEPGFAIVRLLLWAAVVMPGMTLLAGITTFCFRIEMSASGIKGADWWNRAQDVNWQDVKIVRRETRGFFKFLVVESMNSSGAVYVPLFVPDLDSLLQSVEMYGGNDHPLAKAIHAGRP